MSVGSLVLGSINGLVYALLALSLVLVWRSSRFINFALGNLGAFVSVLFAKLVVDLHVPYFLALPVVLLAGVAIGVFTELAILRRLFNAPRLVLIVATIAIAQLLYVFALTKALQPNRAVLARDGYPLPFQAHITIGGVVLNGGSIAIVLVVPAVTLGIAAFLRFSTYGQAVKAAADNPDAARLAGISVRRMSTIVWALVGLLGGITGILIAPSQGSFAVQTVGPGVLVRALAAALIGRMTNMPVAFAAALVLGVVESAVFGATRDGGITDLVVFAILLVALLVRGRQLSSSLREAQSGIGFGASTRPLARDLAATRAVVGAGRVGRIALLAVVVVLPMVPGFSGTHTLFLLVVTCAYAIVAVSLTILTGWGGQVSLGQYALVGVGAFAAARLAGLPFPLVLLLAGGIAALAAVVVGLPALRIQGLFLAVATLAFAVTAAGYFFQAHLFVGTQTTIFLDRPSLLVNERRLLYFALVLLAGALYVARNLRRAAAGRLLIAVRDNDAAARSAGVSALWTRMLGFGISGFMAGVAGVVFAYATQYYNATSFDPTSSLTVLLMVVVGGLGSLEGAILGAVFMYGIPALLGSGDAVRLLTSAVGVLIVLLYLPGGLVSVWVVVRDTVATRLARRELGLPAPGRQRPRLRELWRVVRHGTPERAAPALARVEAAG